MHRIFDLTWFTTHWREIAKWPVALLLSWLRGKRWPLIYPPLLAINVVWCRAPQQGPPSWFVLWWHLSVKAISITPATKCWHAVYLAGIGVVGCTQEISRVIPGGAPRGASPDRQQGVIRRVGLPADVYTSIEVIQNSVYLDKLNNNRAIIHCYVVSIKV